MGTYLPKKYKRLFNPSHPNSCSGKVINCYFLCLVFLWKCYLLASLHLSRLHGNLISLPIFSYLWDSAVPCCTCTPIFLAHITHFLEGRRSWEPGSRLTTGFLSHFRLLPKVSHVNVRWANANHTFSSHIISSSWHFLASHKPWLSQCSTAWARNPQWISKLINQGWLLLVLW